MAIISQREMFAERHRQKLISLCNNLLLARVTVQIEDDTVRMSVCVATTFIATYIGSSCGGSLGPRPKPTPARIATETTV